MIENMVNEMKERHFEAVERKGVYDLEELQLKESGRKRRASARRGPATAQKAMQGTEDYCDQPTACPLVIGVRCG